MHEFGLLDKMLKAEGRRQKTKSKRYKVGLTNLERCPIFLVCLVKVSLIKPFVSPVQ